MLLTKKSAVYPFALILPLVLASCEDSELKKYPMKPTISGNPALEVQSCQSYNFKPTASDLNGDPINFTVTNKPAWVKFSEANGMFTGMPKQGDIGNYPDIKIDAHANGDSVSLDFSIDVVASDTPIPEWTKLVGTGTSDMIYGMTSDNEGNVITAGYTADVQTEGDKFDTNVMKVSKSGELIWSKNYNSSPHEMAYGAAVDSQNNIYISGMTKGNFGDLNASCGEDNMPDPFIVKLDKDGNQLWGRMVCTDKAGLARGIAVDSNDNVYLTGNVNGDLEGQATLGKNDAFIAKYDSDGTRAYLTQIGSAQSDYPDSLVVDQNGNAYVAGYTSGDMSGESEDKIKKDVFVSKVKTDGTILWTKQYGSDETDSDPAIAIDTAKSILYVTGKTAGALEAGAENAGKYDVFLMAMNLEGEVSWTKQYGTAETDLGEDIVLDNDGNIFISGYTYITPEEGKKHNDITLRKISPDGTLVAEKAYGTPSRDIAYGIALSSCGFVYVGGYTRGDLNGESHSGGKNDRFIIHVDGSKM